MISPLEADLLHRNLFFLECTLFLVTLLPFIHWRDVARCFQFCLQGVALFLQAVVIFPFRCCLSLLRPLVWVLTFTPFSDEFIKTSSVHSPGLLGSVFLVTLTACSRQVPLSYRTTSSTKHRTSSPIRLSFPGDNGIPPFCGVTVLSGSSLAHDEARLRMPGAANEDELHSDRSKLTLVYPLGGLLMAHSEMCSFNAFLQLYFG